MTYNIFGLDIKSIVHNSIQSAGGLTSMTLFQTASGVTDVDNPLAVKTGATTQYACQGVVSAVNSATSSTISEDVTAIITVIAGTLPDGVIPNVGDDIVVVSGKRYKIKVSSPDPAGASYELQVE